MAEEPLVISFHAHVPRLWSPYCWRVSVTMALASCWAEVGAAVVAVEAVGALGDGGPARVQGIYFTFPNVVAMV